MNLLTNYLEKLGSNFLVSSMVPSLALVIASILVFDPLLKVVTAFNDPQSTYQLVGFGPMVIIITVIIGFTITTLNTYILKMFEGYVIPAPMRFLYRKSLKIHRRNAYELLQSQQKLKSKILYLEGLSESIMEWEELEELKDNYYQAVADYSFIYPEDLTDILPTKFGNALKAAENYAGDRYGLDGVHFWPRLVHVIPNEYKATIDSVRNELSFLVNMSVLSFIFSMMCIVGIFVSMWIASAQFGDPIITADFFRNIARYLITAALGMISCAIFYNASIFSVSSFGLVIRSSFDLFRMDLLKKLGVKKPTDSDSELDTWNDLNELIVLGSHSVANKKIRYVNED